MTRRTFGIDRSCRPSGARNFGDAFPRGSRPGLRAVAPPGLGLGDSRRTTSEMQGTPTQARRFLVTVGSFALMNVLRPLTGVPDFPARCAA
jgi:hypothetical protein